MEADRRGRDRKRKLRENRESIRDNGVREAVSAEFSEHENLKQLPLLTGSDCIGETPDSQHLLSHAWGTPYDQVIGIKHENNQEFHIECALIIPVPDPDTAWSNRC